MPDVFKDSFIRYFGYANEVGEAFRSVVPVGWVHSSYAVASTYVLADAVHKGWKASQRPNISTRGKPLNVTLAFADTLIWQAFASVIIPGFTINRVCWVTGIALSKVAHLPSPVRKWVPTVVGLAIIPLIIHPIDQGVDHIMDNTLRAWYNYHPHK